MIAIEQKTSAVDQISLWSFNVASQRRRSCHQTIHAENPLSSSHIERIEKVSIAADASSVPSRCSAVCRSARSSAW
jgi:hypothetical protein